MTQHPSPPRTAEEALDGYLNGCLAAIELTVDGTILKANATYLRLSGYSAPELRGRSYETLCPDGSQDGVLNAHVSRAVRQAWRRGQRIGGW